MNRHKQNQQHRTSSLVLCFATAFLPRPFSLPAVASTGPDSHMHLHSRSQHRRLSTHSRHKLSF